MTRDPIQLQKAIAAEPDVRRRREMIVEMLGPTAGWAEISLGVELAVDVIDVPSPEERPVLRALYRRCAADGKHDATAMLRTSIARLLIREPERDDLDLFREATRLYLRAPGSTVDISAELRGLGLVGMGRLDENEARWAAARLLFDGEVPNQEPHLTAVQVLAPSGDHPLLLHWLDSPRVYHPDEAAALAERELAHVLPADLWSARAETRLGADRPMETLGAVEGALASEREELTPALVSLLRRISTEALFRAVALSLAASRSLAVVEAVLDIVEDVPLSLLDAYTDAVSVCRSPRRDAVISRISERARRG